MREQMEKPRVQGEHQEQFSNMESSEARNLGLFTDKNLVPNH